MRNGSGGNRLRKWWTPVRIVGSIIGATGIGVGVFGVNYRGEFALEAVQAFYANVATEFVSIALTIVIIDWLYERRDQERERERLAREMRNPDNGIALMAVEELRAEGWLDGDLLCGKHLWDANLEGVTLVGVRLRRTFFNRANLRRANLDKADLEGARLERADLSAARLDRADLRHADLRHAILRDARLIDADLRHANLHHADLTGATCDDANFASAMISDVELAEANQLRGAIMPDGARYDGRFNLAGDLEAARVNNHRDSDAVSMAAFYGVARDAYERGQTGRNSQ